jgi:hypothetical protein
MQAARKGTFMLIQARLKAYDQMLADGVPKDEAFAKARALTRKQLNIKVRAK